jgi:hypothetical protein
MACSRETFTFTLTHVCKKYTDGGFVAALQVFLCSCYRQYNKLRNAVFHLERTVVLKKSP